MASSSAAVSIALPPLSGGRDGARRPGQGSGRPSWRAETGPTSMRGMPRNERQRIAAYGVVRDDRGRLLLARAAPSLTLKGRWFLPGGGMQHGENPVESLQREIEEESGLTVTVGPLLDV